MRAGSSSRPPTSMRRREPCRRRSPRARAQPPGRRARREAPPGPHLRALVPPGGSAMSDGPAIAPHRPELVTDGIAPPRSRWFELATSSDHKDIGRILIGGALGFLVLGIVEFALIRLQLALPQNDLIEPVTFNRLLSVWGPTVIVLFALPLAIGLYTYLVPLQIGARTVAFPRLANLGLWLFLVGGAALYISFAYTPPEAGVNPP